MYRILLIAILTLPSMSVRAQVEPCASLSLYCIDLVPRPEFREVSGRVDLARAASAFGLAVTRDGKVRYRLIAQVDGLPDPSTLGPYTRYVLWAMPLTLWPMTNMGDVSNGKQELGEVSLNKFMLLLTAEPDGDLEERTGPIVLRGRSPSSRLEPHDMFQVSAFADPADMPGGRSGSGGHQHHQMMASFAGPSGPAMHPGVAMMDAMMTLSPSEPEWLPAAAGDPSGLPEARPREVLNLSDGDHIELHAYPVRKRIAGREFAMLGYNGQIPGPLLAVESNVTVKVTFKNDAPFASSIHWHGLRHENRFDGVPGMTQDPVPPGGVFEYEVTFPDAGIYWYHPHHREEAQQELGLYGNMLVLPPDDSYLPPADRQEVLVLDDFQIGPGGQVPFGEQKTNFALMGRFGRTLLINGEERPTFEARVGERIRWFVTNVSNTRTWNVSVDDHALELVASDLSPYLDPIWEESITMAPAERYVADLYPEEPGRYPIVNRIQSLDHTRGMFFPEVDTLGWLEVQPSSGDATERPADRTPAQKALAADLARHAEWHDKTPDKAIDLLLRTEGLPPLVEWILRADQSYFLPVEFSDTMPMMNWSSTGNEVEWVIREPSTGRENMAIEWTFERDSVEKIRITNRRDSQHAMQHPIHLHGQRFLVLSYNGQPVEHPVWKDTVLIPTGMTADILVEFTNPGHWMIHCHIAEHLETGMKMAFRVN